MFVNNILTIDFALQLYTRIKNKIINFKYLIIDQVKVVIWLLYMRISNLLFQLVSFIIESNILKYKNLIKF